MIKNLVLVFILTSFLLAGCASEQSLVSGEKVFTIGFIPAERADQLTPKAEVLADFLETEMGIEINIVVPTSYEPLMEGLRFGHIDVAYMDSGPAWLAHINADAEVILAELKEGSPYYYGEVFVRSDSDITSLEEVVGKRIAFTSWTGSSGFILPVGTMVSRGIITIEGDDFAGLEKSIGDQFESYTVAGGYEQALTLLVQGKVDIAGGAHDAPETYLSSEDASKIKTLERLGKVPSHPIVVAAHVPQKIREDFVTAMLKLNKGENVHILKELYGVEGLIEANTDEHLGDFGPAFEALTGVQKKVLDKKS